MDLRCHVLGRAHVVAHLRSTAFGEAKVNEFAVRLPAADRVQHHHVQGLHVAVGDTPEVTVRQGHQQLVHEPPNESLAERLWSLLDKLCTIASRDVLEDQQQLFLLGILCVLVEPHDRGMVQLPQQLDLLAHGVEHVRRHAISAHNLADTLLAEGLVTHEAHATVRAAAKLSQLLIMLGKVAGGAVLCNDPRLAHTPRACSWARRQVGRHKH
mmetsp:Transcript_29016/g.67513  ORF Transcript_29016/g.67513 Transcript_29016/m.67513 type:complete len:212 (-) Transcript_29016:92-727(-)